MVSWEKLILLVSFAETSEFLLSGSVPNVESDGTTGSVEDHIGDVDTLCGDISLFKVTCLMSCDECGLADTTISDEN